MGPENTKLVADIIALIRERKDLDIDESEVEFIATIAAGYICSPPPIRAAMVPKFKGVVSEAIKMMRGGRDEGKLPN